MKYITLPESGLKVSVIGLGVGGFGSDVSQDLSWTILDAFFERGGNIADSAHIYAAWLPNGLGASERTLGGWVRSRGVEKEFVVGTKGGHPNLDTMHISRLSPEEITQDLHESLDRLGMDHIDLYYLHRDDPAIPVAEILDVLNRHISSGLIRGIGASNWSVARIEESRQVCRERGWMGFCASQIGWSLAQVNPAMQGHTGCLFMDEATMRYHESTLLPVMGFSSQALGFFTERYHPGGEGYQTPRGEIVAKYYANEENFGRQARAEDLAARLGCSPNQVGLAYLSSQKFPGGGVVGTYRVEQVVESCGAGDLSLSAEDVAFLEGK